MPWGDGIPKINSYSLTDFHDFDFCQFKFYVKHHLDKKYEIEEGNQHLALGSLLDQSIKKFHKAKAYGQPVEYLENILRAAANFMREQVAQKGPKSFFGASVPFLNEELIKKGIDIFKNYYQKKDGRIRKSLGEVGFCEWIIESDDGIRFKLWGGPDAYEMGDDGVPEVVDYKSRQDIENGKNNIDMDLMPKIYILLASKFLTDIGFKKARFVVRIWQKPEDESMYEEFNLKSLDKDELLFRQKIEKILANDEIKFCEREFCRACQSEKRNEFLLELQKMGLKVFNGEEFINE